MSAVEDAALDALARALAPRVAKLLREEACDVSEEEIARVFARAGYVFDRESESEER